MKPTRQCFLVKNQNEKEKNMKKIALTSLLAALVASGANAAAKNVLDGNPLYMPAKGHFVSETTVDSATYASRDWSLGERFGWGITDRLAVAVETSVSETALFSNFSWNEVAVDAAWRLIGDGAWKLDVVGGYGVDSMRAYHHHFWDKDATIYAWNAGVRGGYVTKDWTLMAHANFIYANSESFNWGNDTDMWMNHILNIGFGGHWQMNDFWSTVVTADYMKVMDRYGEPYNTGVWELTAGLNLNLDASKYVGIYVSKDIEHVAQGVWEVQDGFGFGAKFGVDF